jgi:hypothetical protein
MRTLGRRPGASCALLFRVGDNVELRDTAAPVQATASGRILRTMPVGPGRQRALAGRPGGSAAPGRPDPVCCSRASGCTWSGTKRAATLASPQGRRQLGLPGHAATWAASDNPLAPALARTNRVPMARIIGTIVRAVLLLLLSILGVFA